MDKAWLWWTYMPGAIRYLDDAISATNNYRVLIIEEAPYMEKFLELLTDKLRQWDSNLQINEFKTNEWSEDQNIGKIIMDRYATRFDYHPMDGPHVNVIAKNNLLSERVIIFHDVSKHTQWIEEVAEYAKLSSNQNGMLILIANHPLPLNFIRRKVKVLKWKDYITNYDMQLFSASCIAEKKDLSTALRNYIIQLASRLSGNDPELCSRLSIPKVIQDNLELIRNLANENKSMENFSENPSLIESIKWESQIQVLFPIIEHSRRYFIENYRKELESKLPQKDDFGNLLQTAEDMELRHMWYYYFCSNGFYSSENEHCFKIMRHARNQLAHLRTLNEEEVLEIIKFKDQK